MNGINRMVRVLIGLGACCSFLWVFSVDIFVPIGRPSRPKPKQDVPSTNYWQQVSLAEATQFARGDEGHKSLLVRVEEIHPGIKVELRYATTKNATGEIIYPPKAGCYVRSELVEALYNVQKALEDEGFGLVVWDAFQPKREQEKIWELMPYAELMSNPAHTIDSHARGVAIDVTLYSLATGKKVAMPTDFDDMTSRSSPHYPHHSKKVLAHLSLLSRVMSNNGFKQSEKSWWHFELQNAKECPGLDCQLIDSE